MSVDHSVGQLNTLLQILNQEVGYSGELIEITRNLVPTIPGALLNVLLHSSELSDQFFLGYGALNEQDVIGFYKNPDAPMSFFGAYEFESDFLLTEHMEITLNDNLDGALDEPAMIRDISRFLPVFHFQGDYIVADLGEKGCGALLTIVDGHNASFLAPSIEEHIQDIRDGLEQGVYFSGADGLVYPTVWYQRVGVRAGTMRMDEYGEVEEP